MFSILAMLSIMGWLTQPSCSCARHKSGITALAALGCDVTYQPGLADEHLVGALKGTGAAVLVVLAIVPMEIAISTMPTIAVTTKIEIAQMIPTHFGFFATGAPALE